MHIITQQLATSVLRIAIWMSITTPILSNAAELATQDHFDHGTLSETLAHFIQSGNTTHRLVKDPLGGVGYSLDQTLRRYEDNISYRTELRLKARFDFNKEHWLTYKILVPNSWQNDETGLITAQMHGIPDKDLGEPYRNPNIGLSLRGDTWVISGKWDNKRVTLNKGYAGQWSKEVGRLKKGVWETWVFRMTLSYTETGNGRLTIWRDGKQVFDRKGPNSYNDLKAPYFKFGLYKPSWRPQYKNSTSTRYTLYFDDFEMGTDLCGDNQTRPWCPGNSVNLSTPSTPTLERLNGSG